MRSCWAFSPSEVQSRLIAVLRDYAQVAKRLESQEALYLRPGAEVAWHVARGETAQPSPTPPDGWLDHRRRGGALGQVPARFYPGVWKTLEHCSGLVIGDKLDRRNRMESAPLLAEMTPGETNFARNVEHLLAKIDARSTATLPSRRSSRWAISFARILSDYLVLDNYGTYKAPKVHQWFARRPRYHLHFTPTSASWLNQVERWFAKITQQRIRRGTFTALKHLEAALLDYIQTNNRNPKPFVWTATADMIFAKITNTL